MRKAPRDQIGSLKAPLVNPADKYQSKADSLHRYGAWLMGCVPKYIQQFSVWKDELTIYISPSGVLPVLAFLKCTHRNQSSYATGFTNNSQTTLPPSSPRSAPSLLPTTRRGRTASRLYTICSPSATTPASESRRMPTKRPPYRASQASLTAPTGTSVRSTTSLAYSLLVTPTYDES